MSRADFPASILANLRSETPTIALCWRVVRTDDTEIRGTDHDVDIGVLTGAGAGIYLAGSNITGSQMRSTGDLAVDNMEIAGAVPTLEESSPPPLTIDVTVRDIEAGLYAQADAYLYLVNWADPQEAYLVRRGFLGDIKRDSDGAYSTDFRGMKQLLQQVFVRTYSERGLVREFGDEECKVYVSDYIRDGEVFDVASARRFSSTIDVAGSEEAVGGWFDLGIVKFVTGENAGISREVRRDNEGGTFGVVSTWDAFPNQIQAGDTFTITPGCNRLASTCKDKYSNLLNFRGYGIFIEGLDALMRGPA